MQRGTVVFAHGSGSGRQSPRNRAVAEQFRDHGMATLLVDLDVPDAFDLEVLADRVDAAIEWLGEESIGVYGASTGAAGALMAAVRRPDRVNAVVSRGGRPDLVPSEELHAVQAPTLLVVGGNDGPVIEMNRFAYSELRCERSLEIVPGAGHLFEEPGTLDQVAALACDWFARHL